MVFRRQCRPTLDRSYNCSSSLCKISTIVQGVLFFVIFELPGYLEDPTGASEMSKLKRSKRCSIGFLTIVPTT